MHAISKFRLSVTLVVLIGILPMALGCFGNFPLTNAVYKFNGEVSNSPTVRTVAFWAMVIIPVYHIAMLGGPLVFNLVEFWTDKPLEVTVSSTDADGNTVVLAPAGNGRDAILTVSRDGQVLSEDRFIRVSDTAFEVRDAQGNLNGMVLRSDDDGVILADAEGRTIGTLSAASIAALHNQ